MSLFNLISEHFVLPLSDIVLGLSISKNLKFLTKSQYWDKTKLSDFQNLRLRKLVNHAYENVPYYTELFNSLKLSPSDIKTSEDLYKLPILTKEIIKENFPDKIVAKNINRRSLITCASSGSTGEPLVYYITKDAYSFNLACNIRGLAWHGFRLGDRHCKISTNPRGGFVKNVQDVLSRCLYISSQGVTEQDIVKNIKLIRDYEPIMIYGYPSTISILAQRILAEGSSLKSPSFINTHGETLLDSYRKIISDGFKCNIFDAYSGEGGANMFECEKKDIYHISDEYAITELVDVNGNTLEEGRGEIVTTDLWNYAVPMLRYNIKDIAIRDKSKCNCGRNLSTIRKIEGRDSDILLTPSGKNLIVHFFTGMFEWYPSVDQFQVVQNSISQIELYLVVNKDFTESIEKEISNKIQDYIGSDVLLNVKLVNQIPPTRSGKRRFVIRNF